MEQNHKEQFYKSILDSIEDTFNHKETLTRKEYGQILIKIETEEERS